MGLNSRGFRRAFSLIVLVAIGATARVAAAQTTPVTDPTTVSFTPSPDHGATLPDGRPVVDHYTFDVYSVGAALPFQSTDIGKPAPGTDGLIYYNFSAGVAGWQLPGGQYEARVTAVGPMGAGTSAPSNPFTFSTCAYSLSGTSASAAAAGGGTQVTVNAASDCGWTAVSNVPWVTVGPTTGTGIGIVIATVAPNTATSPRTGTLTIAGQVFTINQAGTSIAAPAVPSSPSPASGATGVPSTPTLTWVASGATGYSLAFGTTNPPPQVASGMSAASYAPGSLTAGVTYYWRVVAANSGGSTTGPVWSFTTAAAAPPPAPSVLPSPWTSADVGSVGLAGSAAWSNGTFTVSGSGADIWGAADGFRFVSQPRTGNVEIVARVTGEQNTNQSAKAGIMLRESMAANSAHIILDLRPGGGIEFMTRSVTGAATTSLASATQATPAWLKLVQVGTTVSASVSADGSTWRSVGSTTTTMSGAGYVGLVVTSHDQTLRNTATFDNVTVTPLGPTGLPAGWTNKDVGRVGLSGSTTYQAGKFTVIGSGADIWSTADSFQFAWRRLTVDGQIVARVTGLQNTHTYAKAGLMVRAGTASTSAMAILDVVPSGGVEFMSRSASGGSAVYLAGATQAPPAWLRLVRAGSTITASVSADGATWRAVGSTTVALGTTAYVGLAVTSHNTTVRNTATFDNVAVR